MARQNPGMLRNRKQAICFVVLVSKQVHVMVAPGCYRKGSELQLMISREQWEI